MPNLVTCDPTDPSQQFAFDNATGVFSMAGGSLCVDAGSTVNCTVAPFNTYTYCNSLLGAATRAQDLAGRLVRGVWHSVAG